MSQILDPSSLTEDITADQRLQMGSVSNCTDGYFGEGWIGFTLGDVHKVVDMVPCQPTIISEMSVIINLSNTDMKTRSEQLTVALLVDSEE